MGIDLAGEDGAAAHAVGGDGGLGGKRPGEADQRKGRTKDHIQDAHDASPRAGTAKVRGRVPDTGRWIAMPRAHAENQRLPRRGIAAPGQSRRRQRPGSRPTGAPVSSRVACCSSSPGPGEGRHAHRPGSMATSTGPTFADAHALRGHAHFGCTMWTQVHAPARSRPPMHLVDPGDANSAAHARLRANSEAFLVIAIANFGCASGENPHARSPRSP